MSISKYYLSVYCFIFFEIATFPLHFRILCYLLALLPCFFLYHCAYISDNISFFVNSFFSTQYHVSVLGMQNPHTFRICTICFLEDQHFCCPWSLLSCSDCPDTSDHGQLATCGVSVLPQGCVPHKAIS